MAMEQSDNERRNRRIYYRSHSASTPIYRSIAPPQRRRSHTDQTNGSPGPAKPISNIKNEARTSSPDRSPPDEIAEIADNTLTNVNTETTPIIQLLLAEVLVHELGPEMEEKLMAEVRARGFAANATKYSPETLQRRVRAAEMQKELDEENESLMSTRFVRYQPSGGEDSDREDTQEDIERRQSSRGRGRGRSLTRPLLPAGMRYKAQAHTQPIPAAHLAQAIHQIPQLINLTVAPSPRPTSPARFIAHPLNHQQRRKQTRTQWDEEDDTQGGQVGTSTGAYTRSGRRLDTGRSAAFFSSAESLD